MDDKSKLYDYLDKNIKKMIKEYSNDKLVEIGKSLSFDERLLYEYHIECLNKKETFIDLFAPIIYEKLFINRLIDNNEQDYIVNNIKNIIKGNYSLNDKLLDYLKNNVDNIEENKVRTIKYLIVKYLSSNSNLDDENVLKLYSFLSRIVKNENKTIFDIRKIHTGGFSKIYKVNNKIIKIGMKRVCDEIVDNNRILLPEFKGYVGNDYIEVTDYLNNKENITEEDVYSVYKELRNQGVMWLDPTVYNLARIDKENIIKQKKRKNTIKELGINKNDKYIDRDLNENDLVIIDLDHMVDDSNKELIDEIVKDLPIFILKKYKQYNKRYENEKGISLRKKRY